MNNNQITAEWIAQQRQISEIVNMTYEDAPGSVVPLLKQLEKSQTAAIDALEAAYAETARLTAERDAAVCDMFGCMSTQGQCVRCKKRYYCDGTDDDKFSPLCKNKSHCYAWEWRGLHADNTDAPTGAESAENAPEEIK